MEKIYLVVKHQGEYDEYSQTNLKGFKNKAYADFYKHKLEVTFQKLFQFYREVVQEMGRPMELSDADYDIWSILNNKRNYYDGAYFQIEEIKLL